VECSAKPVFDLLAVNMLLAMMAINSSSFRFSVMAWTSSVTGRTLLIIGQGKMIDGKCPMMSVK
jgi:hypothetical protein